MSFISFAMCEGSQESLSKHQKKRGEKKWERKCSYQGCAGPAQAF